MSRCGIISHRGVCRQSPRSARLGENTVEAFEEGIAKLETLGFPKSIEFDVRLTKDRVPVIIHDATLGRTTDGRGKIEDYLFADLQKFDAGYGRKVPSLSEVLEHFKGQDVSFHIELKEDGLAGVVGREVSAKGLADKAILSAFGGDDIGFGEDPEASSRWEDLYTVRGNIPFALLATGKKIAKMGVAGFIQAAKDAGACAVHPEESAVDETLVTAAHEAGLAVNVWTVNDPAVYKKLSALGGDNVFCDNPDFLA